MEKEPEIICYGCGRGENPENTLEAIDHCLKVNPEWRIDLDLQLTKDEKIVLFHDYNTKRRTGEDYDISHLTLNEVKKLNAGYYFQKNGKFPFRKKTIRIPTLIEVLVKYPKTKFIFDIHTDNTNAIDNIIEIIKGYGANNDIIIVSHYDRIIKQFKNKKPHWVFGAGTNEVKKTVFSSFVYLDFLFPLKSDVLLIPIRFNNIKLLTKRVLRHVKKRNKKIIVWQKEGETNDEVICIENKKEYDELKGSGIDGVYTEFPEQFNKEIKGEKHLKIN